MAPVTPQPFDSTGRQTPNVPIDPQDIVGFLRKDANHPLKAKELAKALGVSNADYAEFKDLLERLENDGTLYRVKNQRYAAPANINLVVGRFDATRSGSGFVVPDEGGTDIFVPADSLNSAVDGDRVVARVERQRRGQRSEGSIIKVLERARDRVVGNFHASSAPNAASTFGFVVPQDRKLTRHIFVAAGSTREAKNGDIVVVRVSDWGGGHRGPAGVIEDVIGSPDEAGNDVLAIAHDHSLPLGFPDDVTQQAQRIQERGIEPDHLKGRRDMRGTLVFTIDPADAKDHDDALSIVPLGEDMWEIGIHIADVSFYVTEGSPLDVEAMSRGTSVYLVDRVIPMLPHELSSDLCSLRENVDRLAMSVILRIDRAGVVHDHDIVRTVIRSRHKLSYQDAQRVLDREHSIDAETDEALRQLLAISRVLRSARGERGSIDFDLPEARVVLAESGEPTDIQRVQRLDTHKLIEDFMLLANETVARRASKAKLPIPYRIHEAPDEMRMEQVAEFAASFGLRLSGSGAPTPRHLQKLLDQARGRPEETLLSTVVLRSMKQARYSEENLGHFGLAASHYAHFTSPIRRYPDLLLHRQCARKFLHDSAQVLGKEAIAPIAKLSSERERVAVAAERDSIDLKKVQFMERHLGSEFEGTISNVRAFGFFVLLDAFFVDGLVHVSSLGDDYYEFQEERFALIGTRTGRTFQLGDRVRVQVSAVNREERKIDFVLLDVIERAGRPVPPASKPKARAGAKDKRGKTSGGKRGQKKPDRGFAPKKKGPRGRGKGKGKGGRGGR